MSFDEERSRIEADLLKVFDRPYNAIEIDRIAPILDRLVHSARAVQSPTIEPLTKDQVNLCIATAGQSGEWYIYHSGVESNIAGREIEHESRTRDGYTALGQLLAAAIQLAQTSTLRP